MGGKGLKGRIHSTETFGTVDGPGIRYVVFLQGCPMRCLYCHNPDTWEVQGGRVVDVETLLNEYEKNKEFLKNGGITATGGEPLLQIAFVTELFRRAKERGIHTCLDTSGITFRSDDTKQMDGLMAVTDLVLLDVKHMDSEAHRKLTGHPNTAIMDFARYLNQKGVPVWIRHVVVPGITDQREELLALGRFIATLSNVKALDILPYHDMAKPKYEALGLEYPLKDTPPMDKAGAVRAKETVFEGIRQGLARTEE